MQPIDLFDPRHYANVRKPVMQAETLPAWCYTSVTFYQREVALHHEADGQEKAFAIAPRLATDSLYALRRAALEGLGAAIVSAWLVEDDLSSGHLIHLAPAWRAAPLPMYLIYPASRLQPRRLRTFIDIVREAMPRDATGPQRL